MSRPDFVDSRTFSREGRGAPLGMAVSEVSSSSPFFGGSMLLLGRKKEEESMCNVTSQVISEEEEAARSKGSNFPLFPRREKEREKYYFAV